MTGSSSSSRPRALVTGASAGIGQAFAERLAADGYDLVLVARRRARLEDLAERLEREAGAQTTVLAADLADARALSEVEAGVASDERLSLVVNNAGFGGYCAFASIDPRVIDSLIDVHVRAVTRLTRAALPGMIRRGTGNVINIASLLALSGSLPPNPLPLRATYAAAKAYMLTFSQALMGELAGTGVHIQVCLPGRVSTEFNLVQGIDTSKLPPMMTAEDVVGASLAALKQREIVCVPALADPTMVERFNDAAAAVLKTAAFQPNRAARYS